MPQQAFIAQIFVASPSDVQGEREILEEVVSEMNRSSAKNAGFRLELLKWETSVHPGFGPDSQAVINEQIGDNYDIFIGIIWGRFGRKTSRAESGTEEEFDRALMRYKATGSPQALVYFKDTPLSPSKIDSEEIKKIQLFKKKIEENGGIYGSFQDISGFQSSLRVHLSEVLQKFATSGLDKIPMASQASVPSLSSEDEGEGDLAALIHEGSGDGMAEVA
jgi:hypothetical protein